MNLMLWRNADDDSKHDVIVMLVIHGLLIGMNTALYVFGAYRVNEMLDGEAYAAHVRLAWGISNAIKSNLLAFISTVLFSLCFDGFIYLALRQRLGKLSASAWNVLIVLLLISFASFFYWGTYAQLQRVDHIYVNPR